MTRDAFIAALQQQLPNRFVEDRFYDRVPVLFNGDREAFVMWKRVLAAKLNVDPACLVLVGSGATGFSLNPHKSFRQFDHESDIDVAVVSPYHFDTGWRYLRMNGSRRLRLDNRTRIAWDEHVTRYIYWGTLATDRLLGVLPFGKEWIDACSHMATIAPTEGRVVNLRIYADFDALRAYQIQSTKTVRDALQR